MRVLFWWRYSMRGAASNTSAAATGDSWLPRTPPNLMLGLMLGRASASASRAIAAIRSSNSSRCRNRSRRWLASCRFWMNRRAGKLQQPRPARMTRCSMIGTATSAEPKMRRSLRKVIIARSGREKGSGSGFRV